MRFDPVIVITPVVPLSSDIAPAPLAGPEIEIVSFVILPLAVLIDDE
jgi:hypothetical protein